MKRQRRVLKSINDDNAQRCVDIFLRADGTYGFEAYRRDAEDARGWFAIGGHGSRVFASEEDALTAAQAAIEWLPPGRT